MDIAKGYELVPQAPSLDAYLHLRAASGLSPKNAEQGAGAIAGSWFFCHVRERATGTAVAMGRVIGDGGWYFHIADVATLPEHQGQGLGRLVVDTLLAHIRGHAPGDPYITLVADPPGRRLYDTVGFVDTAPSVSMRHVGGND